MTIGGAWRIANLLTDSNVRGGIMHPLHLLQLCTQAERDFWSVDHTLTDIRTRLSVHKVEAIELVR